MTWGNRLRLLLGLVIVLVLVGVFTLVFNQRQHTATSTTATIVAEAYSVGADYGGVVRKQYVHRGDVVHAGDPLFDVQSLQLQRDIAEGNVVDTSATISPDGVATIIAPVDGTVADVSVAQGGYAQAGTVLANIDAAGSMYIEAHLKLSARDYARISRASQVTITLPDDAELRARIAEIAVETADGKAESTLRIESSGLESAAAAGLFQPGTPVVATVQLRDDGPFAGVADAFRDLLRKIGL